jgi:hypothetical protein
MATLVILSTVAATRLQAGDSNTAELAWSPTRMARNRVFKGKERALQIAEQMQGCSGLPDGLFSNQKHQFG